MTSCHRGSQALLPTTWRTRPLVPAIIMGASQPFSLMSLAIAPAAKNS